MWLSRYLPTPLSLVAQRSYGTLVPSPLLQEANVEPWSVVSRDKILHCMHPHVPVQGEPHKELRQKCRPGTVSLINFNLTFQPHNCTGIQFREVSNLFVSKFDFRLNFIRCFLWQSLIILLTIHGKSIHLNTSLHVLTVKK